MSEEESPRRREDDARRAARPAPGAGPAPSGDENRASAGIERLLAVMKRLRDPETGCPWDVEQTFETIAPYTIEEAYEVAEAIAEGDMAALREELGDLLLQVVYHAEMAREAGVFDFADVAAAISEKMIARHPHVFGDAEVASAEAQTRAWEDVKAAERARKRPGNDGALDGVPLALPALTRAAKLQRRAARVGFDWDRAAPVFEKVEEELSEVRAAVADASPPAAVEDEIGDLLFAVVNLARWLKVDPEAALRRANRKFERRFRHIERSLSESGRTPESASLEELETLWGEAKAREDGPDGDAETGPGGPEP